jgi:DNA-nicking Smr family endonuclease
VAYADGEWTGADFGGDFDEALCFLQSAFPNYDASCLEEALMNTGGDAELAMELLMDEEIPPAEAPDFDDAEAFPSLGGGASTSSVPAMPEPLPKKIFLSGGMSNVNRASAAATWNSSAEKLSAAKASVSKLERGVAPGTGTKIEWVETGAAVSQLYTTTRDEARDYARIRNVCYEQATNAFLSGNKALAKELSRQGRDAASKMSTAHQHAAHSIYNSRGGGRDGVIDLHGLHVAEALSILRRELARLRSSGYPCVQILVGTGHHTIGSRTPSRLPVAVENFLHQERLKFSEPQSGLLEVRLSH